MFWLEHVLKCFDMNIILFMQMHVGERVCAIAITNHIVGAINSRECLITELRGIKYVITSNIN